MVERYIINYDERGEQLHSSGDFVHYSDYAALEAQLEQVAKKLNLAIAERDFWREADVNSQKQLFECKQSLVTPPAPKVTEEMVEAASHEYMRIFGKHLLSEHAQAILTAAQETGK